MINQKIKKYIQRIIQEYSKLYQLNLDYFRFRLLSSGIEFEGKYIHLTTSGDDEKINARRKVYYESFKDQGKIIVDSYFLCLANLFENSIRDKPVSIVVLVKMIKDNLHLFRDKRNISKIIDRIEKEIESNSDLIELILDHRNKCIAHNDPKFLICDHLNNLHSKQTDKLVEIIKTGINSLAEFFEITKIDDEKLSKMQSESFDANYNLIKKLEN